MGKIWDLFGKLQKKGCALCWKFKTCPAPRSVSTNANTSWPWSKGQVLNFHHSAQPFFPEIKVAENQWGHLKNKKFKKKLRATALLLLVFALINMSCWKVAILHRFGMVLGQDLCSALRDGSVLGEGGGAWEGLQLSFSSFSDTLKVENSKCFQCIL